MEQIINSILQKKQLRYITKEYLGNRLYKQILLKTTFLDNVKLSERLYCIINNITEHPICPYCKIKTYNSFKGINTPVDKYKNKYCCVSHSRKRKFKTQQICQNPNCNNEVKTNINLYCSRECYKICSDIALQKRRQSNLQKYGTNNVSQNINVLNQIKQTKLNKYGDCNYNNPDATRLSRYKTTYKSLEKFKDKIIPLFTEEEFVGIGYHNLYKWKCVKCGNEFKWWYNMGYLPKCHICNPNLTGISKEEKEIVDYIKMIYNGNIIENTKKVINPLELDIYIPEKKIAIEYNGLFWHSEGQGKERKYHLNKTLMCKKQNISLIHIFEDEWVYKKQIVKNRLKHILGLSKYTIYGRKCIIKKINTNIKNKFVNKYHLQKNDKSQIKLGAFYKNRLVAVMTFSSFRPALGRYKETNSYELVRFCTIGNFKIIGIASKLLKYFERKYNPIKVISYADKRWSEGDLYYQLGFELTKTNPPSYWYFMNNSEPKRYHRYGFRKDVIKEKYTYNNSLTEFKNMQLNGFDRVWDCGTYCFEKVY